MPPRLSRQIITSLTSSTSGLPRYAAPFCSSAKVQAGDNFVGGIEDLISPSNPARPSAPTNLPSRPPNSPLRGDSSNRFLLEIPEASSLPAASRPAGISENQWRNPNRSAASSLQLYGRTQSSSTDTPSRGLGGSSESILRSPEVRSALRGSAQRVQEQRMENVQRRQIEAQSSRTWRDGDIYAPHDLSWEEMQKARIARQARAAPISENTRKKGGRDVLDDLNIDPLKEYKNFSLMSQFMSETGKIRHSRDTGLRAVNQRRMAKAIRRAIGIGIMPSVHRHPELFDERLILRNQMRVR